MDSREIFLTRSFFSYEYLHPFYAGMNPLFQAVFECLGGTASDDDKFDNAVNEKNHFGFKEKDEAGRSVQDIATEIIDTLYSAEKNGRDLVKTLDNIVGEYGWVENIGAAILNGLESALRKGVAMGPVMKEAFDKATRAAIGFARDHPVYCTIIALGILVLLTPWVIEAIGFGELGPVEGKNDIRNVRRQ